VRIVYSDALSVADFSDMKYLADSDALHPSIEGQTHISNIVFEHLRRERILWRLIP